VRHSQHVISSACFTHLSCSIVAVQLKFSSDFFTSSVIKKCVTCNPSQSLISAASMGSGLESCSNDRMTVTLYSFSSIFLHNFLPNVCLVVPQKLEPVVFIFHISFNSIFHNLNMRTF
jgi:hypothetical protein